VPENRKKTSQLPPWNGDSREWKTPREVAVIYRKDITTIRKWFSEGFLFEQGWKVFQDPKGHWFARR
jgi:hypothetical protein